jgi:3',5'-cyclic AMP phosphodiesterase CpdA
MYTFRLLHVSDLHVGVRPRVVGFPDWRSLPQLPGGQRGYLAPSSSDPSLVDAAACWLYRDDNGFDAILVTGDLGTTGQPADLALAHDYLFAPAVPGGYWSVTGKPSFQASGAPVYVLPGNHDRFEGWYLGPAGKQFDLAFGKSGWSAGQGAQILAVLGQPGEGEKLAVVAADFTLASYWDATGPWGYMGQGMVYPAVLSALAAATRRVKEVYGEVGVVWAVHFPPCFAGIDPDLALLNELALPPAAAALGVEHLFCGHTHEAREYVVPGKPPLHVHCAGTTTQYATQHGNVMHDTQITVAGAR